MLNEFVLVVGFVLVGAVCGGKDWVWWGLKYEINRTNTVETSIGVPALT